MVNRGVGDGPWVVFYVCGETVCNGAAALER